MEFTHDESVKKYLPPPSSKEKGGRDGKGRGGASTPS